MINVVKQAPSLTEAAWTVEEVVAPPMAWHRRLRQTIIRHRGIPVGGIVLVAIVMVALAAPLLTTMSPTALNPGGRLAPPNGEHLFGTDNFGRDVFSRTLWGARLSLEIGFLVSALTVLMGTAVGLLAGYFRRAVHSIGR